MRKIFIRIAGLICIIGILFSIASVAIISYANNRIDYNLDEALLADRVMVMKNGEVLLTGTIEEVFDEKTVIKEAKLDIFDNLKLIDLIKENGLNQKKEVVEFLWQLTYQK